MTERDIPWDELVTKSRRLIDEAADREEAMQHICALLHREVPHYDWVGFIWSIPCLKSNWFSGPM